MRKIVVLTFMTFCGFGSMQAQDIGEDSTASKPFFSRGSVIHGAYLEHYFSEDADRHISATQLNMEMAYFIWNGLSLVTDAYFLISEGHRVVDFRNLNSERFGVGFAGFLRLDIFDFRFHSLFAETGFGMVFTNKDFPPEGTKWNFTRRYGGGLTIKIDPDARLVLGWRSMHVSNGKGFGHPQNPAYDANGLFAGLRFRF